MAVKARAEPCHSRTLRSPLSGLLTSHSANHGASTWAYCPACSHW